MLDESMDRDSRRRRVTADEIRLVTFLIEDHPDRKRLAEQLRDAVVEDMADGGMGSIRFVTQEGSYNLGATVGEVAWKDEDGMPVSAVLNLDEKGNLFELDIWRVDFAPLLRYPNDAEMRRLKSCL